MGGNQSRTRKLTVENDDPTSVIKVSDDVVQRIKNSQEKATPQPPLSPTVPQQSPSTVQPTFIYEPNVTTVQVRLANVAELKKNDEYWEGRLKQQQSNHQKINTIMENEYKKTVEEMGDSKTDQPKPKALTCPPCQEIKQVVMKCYKENPHEPMKCAKVVQAFQQCVDSKRASVIENRG